MFTGIIQAIGKVREPEQLGSGVRLTIVTPEQFHLDQVHVGDSIAVNGVFSINLIPHTVEVTTLKHLKPQDWVNLEIDTIARYVERMMQLRNNEGDDLF